MNGEQIEPSLRNTQYRFRLSPERYLATLAKKLCKESLPT